MFATASSNLLKTCGVLNNGKKHEICTHAWRLWKMLNRDKQYLFINIAHILFSPLIVYLHSHRFICIYVNRPWVIVYLHIYEVCLHVGLVYYYKVRSINMLGLGILQNKLSLFGQLFLVSRNSKRAWKQKWATKQIKICLEGLTLLLDPNDKQDSNPSRVKWFLVN